MSLNLAEWIKDIPIIYYPLGLEAVAIRFKSVLQENTKFYAITEDIIESSHNGIMSWETPSKIQPILLRGKNDSHKTKQRLDIFLEYFKENNKEEYKNYQIAKRKMSREEFISKAQKK